MIRGPGSVAGLLEREDAVAALADVLAAARNGTGSSLFLCGEPGTGKTALVHAARALAGDDLLVLPAHGSPMEVDLPFAYVEQALGPLAETALAGPHAAAVDIRGRLALVHAAARAQLRRLTRTDPVLLLLDDLHWADPASLQVVGFLARRLARLPVALVAAFRPWPDAARTQAAALVGGDEAVSAGMLAVGSLGPGATARLLQALTDRPVDEPLVHRAWALTQGNPLLVTEAARVLASEGALPDPAGGHPSRFRSALLLSHLAGLPPEALTVAQSVAVLGGRARPATVRAVSEQDPGTFAAALDDLIAAGVLAPADGGRVAFTHDLLAGAVYDDLSPARRSLLHGHAFDHLAELGDVAGAAAHAVPADRFGDDRVVAVLAAAADRAMRDGAVETGLARLAAAAELSGPEPGDDLLARQAEALFLASRPVESMAVYRRLLGRSLPPPRRRAVLARAAQAQAYAGDLAGALDTYERLIAEADPSAADVVPLVLERSHVVWQLQGPAAALAVMSSGPQPPPGAGDDPPAGAWRLFQAVRGSFQLHQGDPSGLAELERQAVAARGRVEALEALADTGGHGHLDDGHLDDGRPGDGRPGDGHRGGGHPEGGDPGDSNNAFLLWVSACGALGRFDEAEEYLEVARRWLRRSGALWPTVPLVVARLGMLVHRGELLQALGEADDLLEELEPGPLLGPYVDALRARALARIGRVSESEALVAGAAAQPGAASWHVAMGLELATALRLGSLGDTEAAAAAFRRIEDRADRVGLGEPCILPFAAGSLGAHVALGRMADAARLVERLEAAAQRLPCTWPRMVAAAGRADMAAHRGEREEADARYREALAVPVDAVLDRAEVLVRYGAWLRRTRRPTEARGPLADAVEAAERVGAAPLMAAARAELSAAGGRRRRARPQGSLSSQQRRVAELAVTGATTREIAEVLFLSPRTVESHLGAVYLKLGVASKAELRRRQVELGLQPS